MTIGRFPNPSPARLEICLLTGDRLCRSLCPKSYQTKTSQTSYASLWYHLKTKHAIERPVSSDTSQTPPVKRTKVQSSLFPYSDGRKSLRMVYAELAYISTRFLQLVLFGTQCSRNITSLILLIRVTPFHPEVKEFWEVAKEETVV